MSHVVRRLREEDAAEAATHLGMLGRGAIDVRTARRILGEDRNRLYVAYAAGRPAGYLWAHVLDRLDGGRMMFLYDLEVSADQRRRGAGRALVEAATADAERAGCAKSFVITNRSNHAATGLYATAGFSEAASDDLVLGLAHATQRQP